MSVSVIIVGFGDEPVLEACLRSVTAQLEPFDEVVLVDHGITTPPSVEGVRVVTPASNGGFGAGCAAGVAATSGDALVFVNSDATLRPGALQALVERVAEPAVGLVGGLVLLADDTDRVNSAGLPVHLTGLSWCDGYGDPVAEHLAAKQLSSVAGALFACRREVWEMLGGMDASYFMYHEDTDLSLRTHLAGLDVVYCPEAVATHSYDFSRNPSKMFHLERNRFLTVFGDYPGHLLARVLPVMLVLEPLYLVIAARDGWAREKLRAWVWLLRHPGAVRARRRRVQSRPSPPHAESTISLTADDHPDPARATRSHVTAQLRAYRLLAGCATASRIVTPRAPEGSGAVVLAAYRPAPDLFRIQLESIAAQTRRDFRCLIGADGDQADVRALVEEFVGADPRFEVIGWDDNVGFYLNFERLLTAVPDDVSWVALSDQDDRWYPDKLERLVPLLDEAALATGQARVIVWPDQRVLIPSTRRKAVPAEDLLLQNQVTGSFAVLRRGLLSVALPFPRFPSVTQLHDHWLGMCAAMTDGYVVTNAVVQDYIQHGSNSIGDGHGLRSWFADGVAHLRTTTGHGAGALVEVRRFSVGWRLTMSGVLAARGLPMRGGRWDRRRAALALGGHALLSRNVGMRTPFPFLRARCSRRAPRPGCRAPNRVPTEPG